MQLTSRETCFLYNLLISSISSWKGAGESMTYIYTRPVIKLVYWSVLYLPFVYCIGQLSIGLSIGLLSISLLSTVLSETADYTTSPHLPLG